MQCRHFIALHFAPEHTFHSLFQYPQFSECCNNGKVLLPPTVVPPSLLKHLILSPDTISRTFCANIRAYYNSFAMACIKANWVSRGPGSISFNPTVTVHGRMSHHLEAMVAPDNLMPCFLSIYIHDTDYIRQGNERGVQMPNLSAQLLQNLTQLLFLKSTLTSKTSSLFEIEQHQLMHPTLIAW